MKPARGFTLIELLVVMTLLSLLMTGLISALRTMAQTETKIDQRFAQLDELRTTHAFLLQTLGRQSVARVDVPGTPGKTRIPFSASADSVTWVGILPVRPNVGGRHYFRLAVEHAETGDALVLRLAPCDANMTPPDWANAERHLLIAHVSGLTVQAQGLPPIGNAQEKSWPIGWQAGWQIEDTLPEQLRLSLQDDHQQEVVSWTIALRPRLRGDDSTNILSYGPGS